MFRALAFTVDWAWRELACTNTNDIRCKYIDNALININMYLFKGYENICLNWLEQALFYKLRRLLKLQV